MSDLIKREDAIKCLGSFLEVKGITFFGRGGEEIARIILKDVPSADRPQGEWIDKGRSLWGCSNCGMEIYSESERDRNEFHKWCSRCGCRMKGADDEKGY